MASSIAKTFALAVAEIGSYFKWTCYKLKFKRYAHVKN